MKALIILLGLAYVSAVYAQNNPVVLTKSIFKPEAPYKVSIEFMVPHETGHLLVVVSDISGRTLFLESKYHFKGKYARILDLEKAGKGSYHLLISTDTKKIWEDFLLE